MQPMPRNGTAIVQEIIGLTNKKTLGGTIYVVHIMFGVDFDIYLTST